MCFYEIINSEEVENKYMQCSLYLLKGLKTKCRTIYRLDFLYFGKLVIGRYLHVKPILYRPVKV